MSESDHRTPEPWICLTLHLDPTPKSKASREFVITETKCERREFTISGVENDGDPAGVAAFRASNEEEIIPFVFKQSKGLRALLHLFLRGFAQRQNITSHGLQGRAKSRARTLHDDLTPHLADGPSWLMKMLLQDAHEKPVTDELIQSLKTQLREELFLRGRNEDQTEFTVNLRSVWQPSQENPHPFTLCLAFLGAQIDKPVHPATYELIASMASTYRFIDDFFRTKTLGIGVRISPAVAEKNCRRKIAAYLSLLAQTAGHKWPTPQIETLLAEAREMSIDGETLICVFLPQNLGANLFRVALWLPMPSRDDDTITLVAVNKGVETELAVFRFADPTPPENPNSHEAARARLDQILQVLRERPDAALNPELVRLIDELHAKLGLKDKGKIEEGSTVLRVILSPARSLALEQALNEGLIEIPEGASLEWQPSTAIPRAGWSEFDITGSEQELLSFLKRAYWYESIIRPWRRLFSFLWPKPAVSPSAGILGESSERTYTSRELGKSWRSLFVDLKIGFFVWPLLTCLLIIISCFVAGLCGQPSNLVWGIATGLALCLAGAQPCSSVVSPLACYAGAVFVGWAFGFSQALLLGNAYILQQFKALDISAAPFKAITGGFVGLSAPNWRPLTNIQAGIPIIVVGIILISTATGIGMSGWLMGQAKKAKEPSRGKGYLPDLAGGLIGCFAGALIPIVKLLTGALSKLPHFSESTSFSCAFAIIGGITIAFVVGWKTKQVSRGIASGIVHAAIAFGLTHLAFWATQNSSAQTSACLICAACGYFHATWFTAAYVIGEGLSNTTGAVYATLLEGVPFYLAFLVTEMLHKPIF